MSTLVCTPPLEALVSFLLGFAEDYMRIVRNLVVDSDPRDLGREILGDVPGRFRFEDRKVGIDERAEELFRNICLDHFKKEGLKIWIRSEHNPEGYGLRELGDYGPDDADVVCDLDPFDGSDQYLKRVRIGWYSAFSFSRHGKAIAAGCVDILGNVLYLADVPNKRIIQVFVRRGQRYTVMPSNATSLREDSVVAAYKGKWKYLWPWVARVWGMFGKQEFAGITHSDVGGSPIYAMLAAGERELYLMAEDPGEPISEISPGAGFVEASGLHLYVLKEGCLKHFDPVAGMGEERVSGLFIAACTEELAKSVAAQLQETSMWDRIKTLVIRKRMASQGEW